MLTARIRREEGGAPAFNDPFERRIALSLGAAMTIGAGIVLAIAVHAQEWLRAANLSMIIVFGAVGTALLLRRSSKAGYLVLLTGAWLGSAGGALVGGGFAAPIAIAFPVLLFFAAWIDNRAVLVLSAASLALFAGLAYLASESMLPGHHEKSPYEALVVYLVVLCGSAGIAYFVSMSQRARIERLRQSRQALRESEERFRHLTALSSDWYWEQDRELKFVSTVGQGEERGGILAAEHIGRRRWELPGTEILGQTWEEHQRLLAERRPFRDLMLRRTSREGKVHYLNASGEPFFDESGAFAGYRGVASDITQRVLAMQEARAADERLQQAIEHLNEAIAVTDADDRIVVSNRVFRELNGITGLDAPGRLYAEHLRHGISIGNFPEAVGREEAWLEERLARRRKGGTAEVQRQDGRWLLVTDQRLPNGGAITFGLDITTRKATEEELRSSRRLLEQVIDAIPMSIFAKDLDSNYVMVNRYMVEFFGTAKEALLKRHTSELPSQEATRQQSLRDDRWVYENRRALVHETWIQKPDGTPVPFHSSKIPLFGADGAMTGLLGINRDITAERAAQKEIEDINASLEDRVRERTAQLESANRELEAFSYSVSHDLKAPLRAIDGAAGIMKMKFGAQLPAGTDPYLARISQSARRMGVLIEGLLEFARLSRQALHRDPVRPEEVVRAVLQGSEAAIQERGAVVKLGALPPCHADALLLRQVYENLFSNALKYSARARPPTVEFGAKREGGETAYYVRDNGVGFDMAYANKLFGVFQRLHAPEQFEGTGIGLALVRRIVERHDGRIWAESVPGAGATFYFTIGRQEMAAVAGAARSAA
ncbi:MAG TPA: PAS domain S-box protein [Burkholderiales bacterium]|nr:PAS domain S-box protein [Burkholderiales bacterium]